MSKKTIGVILLITGILLFIFGVVALIVGLKKKTETALDKVKSLGAKKSKTQGVGERYDYGDYGFYTNNRFAQFSTKRKGTYNKEYLVFDDNGQKILIVNIFK